MIHKVNGGAHKTQIYSVQKTSHFPPKLYTQKTCKLCAETPQNNRKTGTNYRPAANTRTKPNKVGNYPKQLIKPMIEIEVFAEIDGIIRSKAQTQRPIISEKKILHKN
jgi:hypothetical protein